MKDEKMLDKMLFRVDSVATHRIEVGPFGRILLEIKQGNQLDSLGRRTVRYYVVQSAKLPALLSFMKRRKKGLIYFIFFKISISTSLNSNQSPMYPFLVLHNTQLSSFILDPFSSQNLNRESDIPSPAKSRLMLLV